MRILTNYSKHDIINKSLTKSQDFLTFRSMSCSFQEVEVKYISTVSILTVIAIANLVFIAVGLHYGVSLQIISLSFVAAIFAGFSALFLKVFPFK